MRDTDREARLEEIIGLVLEAGTNLAPSQAKVLANEVLRLRAEIDRLKAKLEGEDD